MMCASSTDPVARAAEVLRAHRCVKRHRGGGELCACGVMVRQIPVDYRKPDWGQHLADVLAAAGLLAP